MQQALLRRSLAINRCIGKEREENGGGQGKSNPGCQPPPQSCSGNPQRDTHLAARRARQELTERDQVCIGGLVHPLTTYHNLLPEVAQVRNGAAKGGQPKYRKHTEHFEKRALWRTRRFVLFVRLGRLLFLDGTGRKYRCLSSGLIHASAPGGSAADGYVH